MPHVMILFLLFVIGVSSSAEAATYRAILPNGAPFKCRYPRRNLDRFEKCHQAYVQVMQSSGAPLYYGYRAASTPWRLVGNAFVSSGQTNALHALIEENQKARATFDGLQRQLEASGRSLADLLRELDAANERVDDLDHQLENSRGDTGALKRALWEERNARCELEKGVLPLLASIGKTLPDIRCKQNQAEQAKENQ